MLQNKHEVNALGVRTFSGRDCTLFIGSPRQDRSNPQRFFGLLDLHIAKSPLPQLFQRGEKRLAVFPDELQEFLLGGL